MQLLFFDTFSHDGSTIVGTDDLNLDLVQFPSPVYVKEVRVIPLGAKVHANLPGGARLGATNPAKFDLELFVNNLRAQGASTFENVGTLTYNSRENIRLTCPKNVPTDGLVLRGTYSALTLAVYGMVSDMQDQSRSQVTVQEPVNIRPDEIQRIKEEPVRPPESPVPDGGRSIGESYAAAWTAKHSEVALKAEPPADWLHLHNDDWKSSKTKMDVDSKQVKSESGIMEEVMIKKEDQHNHMDSRQNWTKSRRSLSRDGQSRDMLSASPPRKMRRSRSFSPDPSRDRMASRRSGSRDMMSHRSDSRVARRSGSRLGRRSGSRDRLVRRSGSRGSGPLRYRSSDRSPVGYNYISRSRDHSLERSRYRSGSGHRTRSRSGHRGRSRSPDSRSGGHRPRSASRNGRRSREGSKDSYHRRSYDNSLKNSYRRGGSRSPGDVSRSSLQYSRPGSRDRPHSPRAGGLPGSGGRPRSRSKQRIYRASPGAGGSTYDHKSPDFRRDGSRDYSPRSGRISDRYSRYSRERSRSRDYDRNSLQSSGSRRPFSPRRSLSPRRRSGSPRLRRSISPRYGSGMRSRSRSPFDHIGGRSPDGRCSADEAGRSVEPWKKQGYSPPHMLHRSPSRNGHHDSYLGQDTKDAVNQDALDNVSDISEGDIPDLPEQEEDIDDEETGQTDAKFQGPGLKNDREDVEEISDEEADWSDDFEPVNFSQDNLLQNADGEELDNPIVIFDLQNMPPFTPLKYYRPPVAATLYQQQKQPTLNGSSAKVAQPKRTPYEPRSECVKDRTSSDQDQPNSHSRGRKSSFDGGEETSADEVGMEKEEGEGGEVEDISSRLTEILRYFDTSMEEDIDEMWIERLEQLTQLLANDSCYVEQQLMTGQLLRGDDSTFNETIDETETCHLITRIIESGLDFNLAMKQGKSTNKLRHIKSGMKLLIELLSSAPQIVEASELLSSTLLARLWSLYTQDYMCIPVKLLVLRTLDKLLDYQPGIVIFLSSNLPKEISLALAGTKEKTRIKFSLKNILNKVDLYDTVLHMHHSLLRTNSNNNNSETSDSGATMSVLAGRLDQCVKYLERTFLNLNTIMSHPSRYLPCKHKFDLKTQIFYAPELGYFSVLTWSGVLDALTATLCRIQEEVDAEKSADCQQGHVIGVNTSNLVSSIYSLLYQWTSTLPGLVFLASSTEQVNSLISVLVSTSTDSHTTYQTSGMADRSGRLLVVYRLYALLYLDRLREEQLGLENRREAMETDSVLEIMQSLYSLTFSCLGKQAVVEVLCMKDNINHIVRLCKHSDMSGQKDMKKSAVRGYANELVLMCVRNCEDLGFLMEHSRKLYELGKHDEHSKLSELVTWLKHLPAHEKLHSEAAIQGMLETVRKCVDNSCAVSPEVITSLRILAGLAIPEFCRSLSNLEIHDLVWRHRTLILFSSDTLELLCNLVQKLCDDHSQPRMHTATLLGSRGHLIISVLSPAIHILHSLIQSVIKVRGTTFRDLGALAPLVRVHLLLAAVPPPSPYYAKACQCMSMLESSLLAYTKPRIDPAKDNISKSLWTEMFREVIRQVISTPNNYISGLHLMSQLLPLPLPLPAPSNLTDDERTAIVNSRSLWSAHLHPLAEDLDQVVVTVGGVESPLVRCLLQSVCEQLAGLAPPTCTALLRSLLTGIEGRLTECKESGVKLLQLLHHLVTLTHVKAAFLSLLEDEKMSDCLLRILETCLLNQDTSSETALYIVHLVCDVEHSLASQATHHNFSSSNANNKLDTTVEAESVDTELDGQIRQDEEQEETDQTTSNADCLTVSQHDPKIQRTVDSVPRPATLSSILTVLMSPLRGANHANANSEEADANGPSQTDHDNDPRTTTIVFSIHQLTIRTFMLMLRSEVTFRILKSCLNSTAKRHRTFHTMLETVAVHLGQSQPDDCVVELAVQLLQFVDSLCCYHPGDNGGNLALNYCSLAWLLDFPQVDLAECEGEVDQHPLLTLRDKVQEEGHTATNFETLRELVTSLISKMENIWSDDQLATSKLDVEDQCIENLPASTPILTQWTWRQLVLLPDSTEAVTAAVTSSSLETPPVENELSLTSWWNKPKSIMKESRCNRKKIDLVDVTTRYLGNLDLVSQVHAVCKESSLCVGLDRKTKKVKKSALETKALHNKTIITSFKSGASINLRSGQRSYRGSYSRGDMFRARPPNTSRPPSLHVDDFLMLEQKGQQPTGPTGYNKQSAKAAKELFAQREAAAALQPPTQLREATREPVPSHSYRGGRGRGGGDGLIRGGRGRGGRGGYRRGDGGGGRDGPRGWSPEYRSSEPRDLGREARPSPRMDGGGGRYRGGGGRSGDRRGGWGDRGRGRNGGRGKDRDGDRGRHSRIYSR